MTVSLLPPNATALERAIEGPSGRVDALPVPVDTVWSPETCPAALLPWLAWAFSVDTWNPAWSEKIKRQVIAQSFDVHRVKGTLGAVKRALAALDLDAVTISEWFDYAGDPYTFRLDVELSTRGVSEGEEAGILAAVDAAKNVRSHLDRLRVWLTVRGETPKIGLATLCGETVTVFPPAITEVETQGAAPRFGLAVYGVETVTLYPM